MRFEFYVEQDKTFYRCELFDRRGPEGFLKSFTSDSIPGWRERAGELLRARFIGRFHLGPRADSTTLCRTTLPAHDSLSGRCTEH